MDPRNSEPSSSSSSTNKRFTLPIIPSIHDTPIASSSATVTDASERITPPITPGGTTGASSSQPRKETSSSVNEQEEDEDSDADSFTMNFSFRGPTLKEQASSAHKKEKRSSISLGKRPEKILPEDAPPGLLSDGGSSSDSESTDPSHSFPHLATSIRKHVRYLLRHAIYRAIWLDPEIDPEYFEHRKIAMFCMYFREGRLRCQRLNTPEGDCEKVLAFFHPQNIRKLRSERLKKNPWLKDGTKWEPGPANVKSTRWWILSQAGSPVVDDSALWIDAFRLIPSEERVEQWVPGFLFRNKLQVMEEKDRVAKMKLLRLCYAAVESGLRSNMEKRMKLDADVLMWFKCGKKDMARGMVKRFIEGDLREGFGAVRFFDGLIAFLHKADSKVIEEKIARCLWSGWKGQPVDKSLKCVS
ncbi:hypothetical protein BJ508DRAFT_419722 [Ascobolus immersus RN42]|uniref:Uncharacterized protein n=1 Tax=Ascobolus immersus RN42 TaxID=1160509 RepID=A0A3N4HIY5_ASCIM|nr:hypothetical protein BJ508DRAFT_419722 [Ascobolus immersus RN42]